MTDRRAAIISAAISLFSRDGYAAVGMVDIGAACDLSAAALYLHFPSKAALLDAVCSDFMRKVDEHLQHEIGELEDPRVRFVRRMRSHAEFVVGNRDQLRVIRREIEHLPLSDQRRIRSDVRRLMDNWIADLRFVRPELAHAEASVAAFAGLSVLQSIATNSSGLAEDDLVDLLAAGAAAAQLADWSPSSLTNRRPTKSG